MADEFVYSPIEERVVRAKQWTGDAQAMVDFFGLDIEVPDIEQVLPEETIDVRGLTLSAVKHLLDVGRSWRLQSGERVIPRGNYLMIVGPSTVASLDQFTFERLFEEAPPLIEVPASRPGSTSMEWMLDGKRLVPEERS